MILPQTRPALDSLGPWPTGHPEKSTLPAWAPLALGGKQRLLRVGWLLFCGEAVGVQKAALSALLGCVLAAHF